MDLSEIRIVAVTIASCLGAFLAYRGYVRKSGLKLRRSYTFTSTVACADDFVSRVVIENLKDRAVTIFGIYLQMGYNVYVVIEEFGDEPLIIRPFETWQRHYDPIEFYSVNLKRVSIERLLGDKSVRKRLVISTSAGKYVVRRFVQRWNPIYQALRNYGTMVVRPMRSTFKGKVYGSNTAFVLELKLPNDSDEIVPIYCSDYQIRRFRKFALTRESLESKEALQVLLDRQRELGNLDVKSVTVHDVRAAREEQFEWAKSTRGDPVVAPKLGMLQYYVLGWLLSRLRNWEMRRGNRKRAKKKVPVMDKS